MANTTLEGIGMDTSNLTEPNMTEPNPTEPRQDTAMRGVRALVGTYLGISAATLVAIVLLRNHPAVVNPAVWTRGTIVVASALLSFSFAVRAGRGSRRALLRLRIISVIMVVAIATIIALPGTFPVWMKIEQGVCGAVLLAVAVLVNGKRVRSLFAGR